MPERLPFEALGLQARPWIMVRKNNGSPCFRLLASGGLAAAKFAAAMVSGSLGLLSEAFHSLMDFCRNGLDADCRARV